MVDFGNIADKTVEKEETKKVTLTLKGTFLEYQMASGRKPQQFRLDCDGNEIRVADFGDSIPDKIKKATDGDGLVIEVTKQIKGQFTNYFFTKLVKYESINIPLAQRRVEEKKAHEKQELEKELGATIIEGSSLQDKLNFQGSTDYQTTDYQKKTVGDKVKQLVDDEIKEIRDKTNKIMNECIEDAITSTKGKHPEINWTAEDIEHIAVSLFISRTRAYSIAGGY